jgi:hypothetical protein
MKKWLAGSKSGNLGESSTVLESVTRDRIESVSKRQDRERIISSPRSGVSERDPGRGGQGDKEGEGSEEEVEGEEGEEMVLERGEGPDDDEYEQAAPPASADDHCDWGLVDIGYMLN